MAVAPSLDIFTMISRVLIESTLTSFNIIEHQSAVIQINTQWSCLTLTLSWAFPDSDFGALSVIPHRPVFQSYDRVATGFVAVTLDLFFVEINAQAGGIADMEHPVFHSMSGRKQCVAFRRSQHQIFLNAEVRGPGIQVRLRGHAKW